MIVENRYIARRDEAERCVVTTGEQYRIPRERWFDTDLIEHIQHLDLRGIQAGDGPEWMARVGRVRILSDCVGLVHGIWPRPLADTIISLSINIGHLSHDPPAPITVVPSMALSQSLFPSGLVFSTPALTVVFFDPPIGIPVIDNQIVCSH